MTFKSSPTSVKSFVQSPLYPGQSLGDFVKIKGINIDECSFSNGSFEVWNQKREWHSITFINAKWSNRPRGLFVSKYCNYLSVFVCIYLCVDVCVSVSVGTSSMKIRSFYHSTLAAPLYFRKQDQYWISCEMTRGYLESCQTSMVKLWRKLLTAKIH